MVTGVQGSNNFAVDPPNAVLILDDEVEQRQDLGVIELFNPEYDAEANTLKYDITAENATTTTTTSINLPGEFGQSTLVISWLAPPSTLDVNLAFIVEYANSKLR